MPTADGPLTLDALRLDGRAALDEVAATLPELVFRRLRKRGFCTMSACPARGMMMSCLSVFGSAAK